MRGATNERRRSRRRIEIDDDAIGPMEIGDACRRHVQLDDALVPEVREVLGDAHHGIDGDLGLPLAAARHGDALDRVGIVRGDVLLEEPCGAEALREAAQRERPVDEVDQRVGGDALVVRDDLALGPPDHRKNHPIRVRHLQHRPEEYPRKTMRRISGSPRAVRLLGAARGEASPRAARPPHASLRSRPAQRDRDAARRLHREAPCVRTPLRLSS